MTGGRTLEHDWFPRALPANVVLGERSWCYSSFAFLHYHSRRPCGVRVGSDSGIYHGSFFNLGPAGEVVIGDFATLVGAIISTNGRVFVGDYAFLAHEVVLADFFADVPGGRGCDRHGWAGSEQRSGSHGANIVVGRNTWVGARAVLLSGAVLNEGAIVGAAAVVDFEVPPFAVVAGNPARVVGSASG
jgi:acetyltransferase-like isoleucine patch superfamily enzyme